MRSTIVNSKIVSVSHKPKFFHVKVFVHNYPQAKGCVLVRNVPAQFFNKSDSAVGQFTVKKWNSKQNLRSTR